MSCTHGYPQSLCPLCSAIGGEFAKQHATVIEPQFKHDCTECIFLGRNKAGDGDLYVHRNGHNHGNTYICRYGNEGSEYTSAPDGVVSPAHEDVYEAYLANQEHP